MKDFIHYAVRPISFLLEMSTDSFHILLADAGNRGNILVSGCEQLSYTAECPQKCLAFLGPIPGIRSKAELITAFVLLLV